MEFFHYIDRNIIANIINEIYQINSETAHLQTVSRQLNLVL